MAIKSKRGFIISSLVTLMLLASSSIGAFATENTVLNAVNIEGSNDSFNITLKTSKDTQVLTTVPSTDKLIIDLDNTVAADFIKTSFKNAGRVEDIIVQPQKGGKTRLFISGSNVSQSRIVIDSTQAPAATSLPAAPVNTNNVQNNTLNKQIQQNQTITSEEFIQQNSQQPANTTEETKQPQVTIIKDSNPQENPEEVTSETTGVSSSVPSAETTSVEDNNINTESSDGELAADSNLFKPAADLEMPDNTTDTTTSVPSQDSAAVTTAQSIMDNTQADSIFTKPWMLRFAIVFVLITALVAYLRKEKILSFKPRSRKPALSQEHLDIYRSLHEKTRVSAPYNKQTTRTSTTSLDSINARKQQVKAREAINTNKKILTQYTALSSYKTQNNSRAGAKSGVKTSGQYNNTAIKSSAVGTKAVSSKKPAAQDNVAFLKSMADLYEKSGRHDLAMNIQKNIRRSATKA